MKFMQYMKNYVFKHGSSSKSGFYNYSISRHNFISFSRSKDGYIKYRSDQSQMKKLIRNKTKKPFLQKFIEKYGNDIIDLVLKLLKQT